MINQKEETAKAVFFCKRLFQKTMFNVLARMMDNPAIAYMWIPSTGLRNEADTRV